MNPSFRYSPVPLTHITAPEHRVSLDLLWHLVTPYLAADALAATQQRYEQTVFRLVRRERHRAGHMVGGSFSMTTHLQAICLLWRAVEPFLTGVQAQWVLERYEAIKARHPRRAFFGYSASAVPPPAPPSQS